MSDKPDIFKILPGHKPLVMGVLNVTPDSFSDGGLHFTPDGAADHARRLLNEGADIIDIGGESTRPGAKPVSPEQEQERILPVIQALMPLKPFISVDTRHADTMKKALAAGASMINDVTALQNSPESMDIVAQTNVPVCLMHMQGNPQTMQNNPEYRNIVHEIMEFFVQRISACEKAGIDRKRLILDPGIGFGKTLVHNLEIIRNIDRFHELGCPVLIGASRKSFIARIEEDDGSCASHESERKGGSLAAALWCSEKNAHIMRVHDVFETKQALRVWKALTER